MNDATVAYRRIFTLMALVPIALIGRELTLKLDQSQPQVVAANIVIHLLLALIGVGLVLFARRFLQAA